MAFRFFSRSLNDQCYILFRFGCDLLEIPGPCIDHRTGAETKYSRKLFAILQRISMVKVLHDAIGRM